MSCFRLLEQPVRAAASRTFWTAGNSRPINRAMIAMTTRSSTSVNAGRTVERVVDTCGSPGEGHAAIVAGCRTPRTRLSPPAADHMVSSRNPSPPEPCRDAASSLVSRP